MDDQRLKELGGGGYFKELLERIRVEREYLDAIKQIQKMLKVNFEFYERQ